MEIRVLPDYSFALEKVFSGVLLVSPDKEEFGICMRDSGFEFQYAGIWYEAKRGVINLLGGKPMLEGAKNTEQQVQPDNSPKMCEECGEYPADLPSNLCCGCDAYKEHLS